MERRHTDKPHRFVIQIVSQLGRYLYFIAILLIDCQTAYLSKFLAPIMVHRELCAQN